MVFRFGSLVTKTPLCASLQRSLVILSVTARDTGVLFITQSARLFQLVTRLYNRHTRCRQAGFWRVDHNWAIRWVLFCRGIILRYTYIWQVCSKRICAGSLVILRHWNPYRSLLCRIEEKELGRDLNNHKYRGYLVICCTAEMHCGLLTDPGEGKPPMSPQSHPTVRS